ncbi:hypothetical protein ABNavy71_058 [Acinetobacter phage AB-Navy71]|nr:hypothetical protein ABNavy71_058 [Acinetobacter phage AB-Navy71]
MKTPKIENVVVKIVRATESSGNVQYWVRATRTDDDQLFGNNLDYHCFQTAYNGRIRDEEDCINDALFSAIMLLKFFGHKGPDLQLIGFTEENMKVVEEAKRFWRVTK